MPPHVSRRFARSLGLVGRLLFRPPMTMPASGGSAASVAREEQWTGQLVDGRYRVGEPLGSGAMGIVHAGVHEQLGRRVAIKVLRREHRAEAIPLESLRREARTLAAVANPHIVEVYDFGELDGGGAYVVMEYLDGHELGRLLTDLIWFPWRRAVDIALQVCDGMSAAHRAGIIHRDLKPENLFLVQHPEAGDRPFVKILDFGIAKLLRAPAGAITFMGRLSGTPEYMAPEQCRGSAVDERADIYALGTILFELVSGAVPFDAPSPLLVLEKQREAPVPSLLAATPGPGVPAELDELVGRCLAKDPAARFGSMSELAEALRALLADHDEEPTPLEAALFPGSRGDEEARRRPISGYPTAGVAPSIPPVSLLPLGAVAALSALSGVGLASLCVLALGAAFLRAGPEVAPPVPPATARLAEAAEALPRAAGTTEPAVPARTWSPDGAGASVVTLRPALPVTASETGPGATGPSAAGADGASPGSAPGRAGAARARRAWLRRARARAEERARRAAEVRETEPHHCTEPGAPRSSPEFIDPWRDGEPAGLGAARPSEDPALPERPSEAALRREFE